MAGYNTLAYLALQTTTATNAVLLNSFVPIATITLAWIFFKKHLSHLESTGSASLLGALTIITCGKVTRPPSANWR